MNKKLIISLLIFFGILIPGAVYWQTKTKPEEATKSPAPVKTKVENINQLAIEKRPYIIIEPKSTTMPQDIGHWIMVTIDKASAYQEVEYDVEYQAGNLIQGFMHTIDLKKETQPASKEGFFGSESKGKYKYDENVTGGSILFKFFYDESKFDALKTYFNLQNMAEREGVFTSNDAKATLKVGSQDLKSTDYVVISSTLGLPAPVEGKILSEPYGFYSSSDGEINATLTLGAKEALDKAVILSWDGKKWQELDTTLTDNQAKATVTGFGTYLLIQKD